MYHSIRHAILRNTVDDIRNEFVRLKAANLQRGNTYEITAASFIADEPAIFGTPNQEYIDAEIKWYKSKSLNVNNIADYYGKVPAIWIQTADNDGYVNSNYGWCIFSEENHNQYLQCLHKLGDYDDSRHGVMYYTRPTMHYDSKYNGMSDHMCTFAVQYHLIDNVLDAHVYMRSNDAIYGYLNDYAWQSYVLDMLVDDLSHAHRVVRRGDIHWHASSLHVYPRHYGLIC